MIHALSTLTPNEIAALRELAERWQAAHAAGEFEAADRYRSDLMQWGAWPIDGGWHPVFESVEHRAERFRKRLEWPFPSPSPAETPRTTLLAKQYGHLRNPH